MQPERLISLLIFSGLNGVHTATSKKAPVFQSFPREREKAGGTLALVFLGRERTTGTFWEGGGGLADRTMTEMKSGRGMKRGFVGRRLAFFFFYKTVSVFVFLLSLFASFSVV